MFKYFLISDKNSDKTFDKIPHVARRTDWKSLA